MAQTGRPQHGGGIKRNAGHALSKEVIDAIAELPQVKSGEWSRSFLAEQLWRNYLGLPCDYTAQDLELAKRGLLE